MLTFFDFVSIVYQHGDAITMTQKHSYESQILSMMKPMQVLCEGADDWEPFIR